MRTHVDVQAGYRPWRPTVKVSGGPRRSGAPGSQISGPPEAGPVERYAPAMGYPDDEGGGPPDSRLGAPSGRAGGQADTTRSTALWPPAPGEEEPGQAAVRRGASGGSPASGTTGDDAASLGYRSE